MLIFLAPVFTGRTFYSMDALGMHQGFVAIYLGFIALAVAIVQYLLLRLRRHSRRHRIRWMEVALVMACIVVPAILLLP